MRGVLVQLARCANPVDCDPRRIRRRLIDTPGRNQPPFGAQVAR
ncbi:hypothetical protein [Gemmatimonas sp.]|nr:hypothetical protein [Gemmatimonas sp.]